MFATFKAQAAMVNGTGLGNASSSLSTRTAEATTAAAMDEGASRVAARIVCTYVSDTPHWTAAVTASPPPGVLEDGELARNRASMYARIDAALSMQPKYTPALNTAKGRVLKKVGVARGCGAATEVFGSSNPFFKWTGAQLPTTGIKYTH